MIFGFFGKMESPILPTFSSAGKPESLVEIFCQDSPPSLDLKIPDEAPLSTNFHALRSLYQSVA